MTASLALLVSPLGHARPMVSLFGWLLAGFVSVGLLAVFTYRDSAARANPWYVGKPGLVPLRSAVLVVAALAVMANAWFWADWFSRR